MLSTFVALLVFGLAGAGGGLMLIAIGWIAHKAPMVKSGAILMGVSTLVACVAGVIVYRSNPGERKVSVDRLNRPAELDNMRVWFEAASGLKLPSTINPIDGRDAMPEGFFIHLSGTGPDLINGFTPISKAQAVESINLSPKVKEFWKVSFDTAKFFERKNQSWRCYIAVDDATGTAYFAGLPQAH